MDSLCAQVLSPYCLVCTLDWGRDCIRRTHWESLGALGSVWELLGTFGQSAPNGQLCYILTFWTGIQKIIYEANALAIVVPDGHERLFIVFT